MDFRKLDPMETQARIIEMADYVRAWSVATSDLPRHDDLVLMLANALINRGRWQAIDPTEPTPCVGIGSFVFDGEAEI